MPKHHSNAAALVAVDNIPSIRSMQSFVDDVEISPESIIVTSDHYSLSRRATARANKLILLGKSG